MDSIHCIIARQHADLLYFQITECVQYKQANQSWERLDKLWHQLQAHHEKQKYLVSPTNKDCFVHMRTFPGDDIISF